MQTNHSAGWLAWALILILACCGGCGGNGQLSPRAGDDASLGMAWPPPELPERAVQTVTHVQAGREAAASGGNASFDGDDIVLVTGATVAWARYSISGQTANDQLSEITMDFTATPQAASDGTRMFLGFANYELDMWEWELLETGPYNRVFTDPAAYIHNGQSHIVAVMDGPGEGRVSQVIFETTGSYVDPPTNLTAEATGIDLVELDWDDVESAAGYNVYRADNAGLTGITKVNTELVTASEYNDTGLGETYYYYYYVTAVSANESAPSNVASTWIFKADYAAPTNLRVTNRAETSFTLEWDWEGSYPEDGFVIYYDFTPDFIITDDTLRLHERWDYAFTMNYTEPGIVYYWKLAALEDGPHDIDRQIHGRLSEEATATCTGFWTWGDVNTIATGLAPLRAVKYGDDIAVAYRSGETVAVAVGLDDSWSISTALSGPGDVFGEQVDMDSNGSTIIVVSQETSAHDAHAAYGTPGNWTNDRVHGDGSTVNFHPTSGYSITCAIDDTEMAVVHQDQAADSLRLHTKTIASGSWTNTAIRTSSTISYPVQSLAYLEGNLFILGSLLEEETVGEDTTYTRRLRLANRDSGWSEANWIAIIEDVGIPRLDKHYDLHYFDSEWYSPGLKSVEFDLYLIHGTTAPWSGTQVNDTGTNLGYNARLDIEDDEAILLFSSTTQYYFAFYSKSWQYFPIVVPGTSTGDYAENADIVLLNGSPYFVFLDEGTGEIKIAMGTPPE
ncbi:hypothetical protein JW859_10790 [bacterium]|nr:hypothetical protein [bacterium]